MIVWWTSPPRILQIHSPHQVATGTPSYVPLLRRGIIITIFHGFGTNCMVPSDWDSAPRRICGPDFISDWIGESPIFPAARAWFSWHSQNLHRYSLSIDCIASKWRRAPSCQGGSQARGSAGRSGSPSVRRRTEILRPSFLRCWPTWISRPLHLQCLPPWPTTSAQASNRTAGRSYGSEVGCRPYRGVDSDRTRSQFVRGVRTPLMVYAESMMAVT